MPTSTVKKPLKKVTKKTVAKKAPAKKKATSKGEFRALVCAIDGECFWSRDGQILSNLADLRVAIGYMDEEVFLHHVNQEKNDFADWVEYVLQDKECADALRKGKRKAQLQKVVELHLSKYST